MWIWGGDLDLHIKPSSYRYTLNSGTPVSNPALGLSGGVEAAVRAGSDKWIHGKPVVEAVSGMERLGVEAEVQVVDARVATADAGTEVAFEAVDNGAGNTSGHGSLNRADGETTTVAVVAGTQLGVAAEAMSHIVLPEIVTVEKSHIGLMTPGIRVVGAEAGVLQKGTRSV